MSVFRKAIKMGDENTADQNSAKAIDESIQTGNINGFQITQHSLTKCFVE